MKNNQRKMKKVRSVSALFLSALVVFCLVCTCAPPTDGDEEDASITITIGGGSRTALSWDGTIDSTQLDHNITLTNDSGGKVEKTGVREGQSVQFVVKPGHWNISVKAYYNGTLVAQGAASVNLKRGRNPSVPITMTQYNGGSVEKTLIGIEVSGYKHEYNIGEAFVTTGIVVTANYSDGTDATVNISEVNFSGFSSSTLGNKIITVRWQGAETTFTVNIIDPSLPTVATPTAIPGAGHVAANTEVTLSTATQGAVIWYTTNGTLPTKNSTRYSGSFTITPPVKIMAFATLDGMNDSDVLEVDYTATPITAADISITPPSKGAVPTSAVNGEEDERFTASAIIWSPVDTVFMGGKTYTATVTLTAKAGYVFTVTHEVVAKINTYTVTPTHNIDGSITLSYTFGKLEDRAIKDLAITSSPTNLSYTHGDTLNLSGLAVTLTYDTNETEVVGLDDFGDKIISTPANGIPLVYKTHNGTQVEIKCGGITKSAGTLTVSQKNISDITIEQISDKTYTGSAIVPAVSVKHQVAETVRELVQGTDYNLAYADNTDAGTAKVTVSGINDYMGSRTVNFTINKANPSSWPTATGITYGATLSTSTLSGGDTHGNFAWADGTTVPPAGTNAYGVTFTPYDTANYNTATGTVSISVAKADPTVADFEIGNSNSKQMVGNITAVTVTPHDGKSDGNITIYYNGSTALPTAVGIYTVTFNVGEGTNYKAATGFSAGTITIFDYDYITDDIGDRSYGWEFIDFNTWLDAQPKNTPETPYIIALNISNAWQPENELIHISASYEKYVYFDLSGGTLTTIPDYAFGGGTFDSYGFGLVGITIPASVTSIGNYALNSQPGGQDPCANLTSVIFAPNSKLTSIGASAFAYCSSLTSIDIPDSVISIGGAAFYNCTSLTNITIPEGVTSIATNTFQNCTSLTSITFKRADISISSWPTTIINANSTTSLLSAYASGGIGTYTRESGGSVWTKQE